MVPPHVSPISHASSSPRFSSSKRGRFLSSTSAVSSMTWASTQPPIVTEPRTPPPSPTSILAPAFRGDLLVTRARAGRSEPAETQERDAGQEEDDRLAGREVVGQQLEQAGLGRYRCVDDGHEQQNHGCHDLTHPTQGLSSRQHFEVVARPAPCAGRGEIRRTRRSLLHPLA